MHSNQTGRARLVRRIARAVGVMAIASGVAVTGGATTTHAEPSTTNTLNLHNNSATNYSIVSGKCDGFTLPDASKSYWHFIVSTNSYAFVSITLHLVPPNTTTVYTNASAGVSMIGKHAYIPVPTGATLASLQLDSTAVITPAAPVDHLPNFNLSHTCSAGETTPPPPTDVCPNTAGNQASVPDGQFLNEDGDCVPDVCTNLPGGQETVPQGYTSNGEGTCTPVPPVDVCNNIDDVQTKIPDGMISDGDGGCITPPIDVCNNIDDVQTKIPDGMISDGEGGCITPPPPIDVCKNIDGNQDAVGAACRFATDDRGAVTPRWGQNLRTR